VFRTWKWLRRSAVSLATSAAVLFGESRAAFAQVVGAPDSAGLPGGALVGKVINWLMYLSLMACLGAIVLGAAMWRGGAKAGNSYKAEDGRQYVIGGAIGALITGLAVTLVNTLFAAGQAGG
jgi:hypothetical protein